MKSLLASLWQRRWCRLLGIAVILCALPMLHPVVRQSIFGPQIEGIPWCVWEDDVRRAVHRDQTPPGWFMKTMEKLGLARRRDGGELLAADSNAVLPLYLHLADDRDIKVRRHALGTVARWTPKHEAESVPLLLRHLEDADPQCRINACWGLVHVHRDADVKPVVLALCQHADKEICGDAVMLLLDLGARNPELFDAIVPFTEHTDSAIRGAAVYAMGRFGPRGVPIVRKALRDTNARVRWVAISAAFRLGKDALPLIPDLQAVQDHGQMKLSAEAAGALYHIDPKQFAKPAD